jgi:hypothetical protein
VNEEEDQAVITFVQDRQQIVHFEELQEANQSLTAFNQEASMLAQLETGTKTVLKTTGLL